ncbi:uncharacterized protein LOC134792326 [Cydia splendana]|uniref:uncharacterized protein LOC134792326 n=1 Tax=Cydia splendana TaxID=1100963 RepID=UPI00300C940A
MSNTELYALMKEELRNQAVLIENNSEKILRTIDDKIKPLQEENKILKSEVEILNKKVNTLENITKQNNIIIHGLNESDTSYTQLSKNVTLLFEKLDVKVENSDINKMHRIGRKKEDKIRPVLISFTTYNKKIEILKNKKKVPEKMYITEDFTKATLEKRKELQGELKQEREKGNKVYIRNDKLIIKPKENEKRKREDSTSPSRQSTSATEHQENDRGKIAQEDIKDTFYGDLERTLGKAHKTIFLMGDFNGQIGKRQAGEDAIMGLHDENQPREQAGFRSDFSTMDHIHVIKQVIEKCNEYGKIYYLAFIDYNKAFDSLRHTHIWDALRSQGVLPKYIRIIKNIYKDATAKIQTERIGVPFKIKKGVRQGDPLSPKLFSAVLEHIFRKMDWDAFGININGEKLNHLRFADDLIVLSDNQRDLEKMLVQLEKESNIVGLTLNTDKTKLMTNHEKAPISLNNSCIEYVNQYTYLGQIISPEDQMTKEINTRICNAWKSYWSLKEVMKNPQIPIKDKTKVFNSCILPCLTYGSQTWALTEKHKKALQVCQNNMERSILNIKLRDRVRLTNIRSKTKVADVTYTVMKLKWNWTGHTIRNQKNKWSKDIIMWYPRDGKRRRGRQRKRWEDEIMETAGKTWRRKAANRKLWQALGEAYAKGAS